MATRIEDPAKEEIIRNVIDKIVFGAKFGDDTISYERFEGLCNIVNYLCIDVYGYVAFNWYEHE